MKLSRLQCHRFFSLFDPLTIYANAHLDVVEAHELVVNTARGIDELAQAKVAYELWQNLNVIDDFVRDNPARLTSGELETVAAWRKGLTGHFLVYRFPDGVVRLFGDGYAFDVCGLSKEIEDMVGALPAFVQTTLLPFDSLIVYSEYLNLMPVGYSDSLRAMIEEDAQRLLDEGLIVTSGSDLIEVADALREKELATDIEGVLADLEDLEGSADDSAKSASEMNSNTDMRAITSSALSRPSGTEQKGAIGQHRGVLAGLNEEERERAIREQVNRELDSQRASLTERLKKACEKGAPRSKLSELFMLDSKEKLKDAADLFDVRGISKLKKAELAERLAAEIPTIENLDFILSTFNARELRTLKNLVDQVGMLRILEDDITTLANIPRPSTALCYAFYENGLFTFIMPDEMYAIAQEVDWDYFIDNAERYDKLIALGEMLADLRGLVPIDEVNAECERLYPGLYDNPVEFVDDLLDSVATRNASFSLVDDGKALYLMHYELSWQRDYDLNREPHEPLAANGHIIDDGPLGTVAESLLVARKGKEPRSISPDMLEFGDLLSWKEAQGPTRALRNFFDANVPDEANDYYFADKVVEDLLEEMRWGQTSKALERYFDILEDNGFTPSESQLQELLNLLMNVANSLPIWQNNGWAPNELLESELGHRVFRNEDGTPKKIGRNDPCPCGSGKKYKKCCGR